MSGLLFREAYNYIVVELVSDTCKFLDDMHAVGVNLGVPKSLHIHV